MSAIIDLKGPHAEVIEQLNMPASFVILDRVVWGVDALLGKLEVTAPWRAMLLEYRVGGPPATELGVAEAAWWAAAPQYGGPPWLRPTAGRHRRSRPGPADRLLPVGRDDAVRGARRLGGHGAGGRRQGLPRGAQRAPRLARRAVARALPAVPGIDDRTCRRGLARCRRRAGRTGADDRAAGRGLPRAAAAADRGVHATTWRGDSALTDAPTVRALQLVLRDELDDWRDG